jgi:hypothetical protein
MKRIVHYDCHALGLHGNDFGFISQLPSVTNHHIYGGDNLDLKNCSREGEEYALQLYGEVKRIYGNHRVSGNHECDQGSLWYFVDGEEFRTGFTHGDLISLGYDKAMREREKSIGAGKIHRSLIRLKNIVIDPFWNPGLSQKELDRAYSYAFQYDFKQLVIGHKHPKTKKTYEYKGITIHLCPRGQTIIDV